ncbi:hypothetical protein ACXO8N_03550 [Lactobacillus delbrueckii subsp. bulgaricus]|nr:hypothetical protein [Lactobacillus delbrueckii subsp. bulgaricus]MBT9039275.1 hypothetical protein [Lactobacillus delbrueckii subsp. bulgaricus]MBT9050294.1 hypothetical protein [Lactobacillus delbrueckii subsp. bulgaricus]MBT9056647.1 hypothetical protein [Lactobacillus delbrueckii subsp. bulgaricus]MBT9061327.1 hypothetical protein [Lactobacillus delbrueckii subsp. bulgaricus]
MGFGQSQRNIADDVYDGAFKDLVITSPDGERVYYDNRLHGWELVSYHWKYFWNKVIDWFINNLQQAQSRMTAGFELVSLVLCFAYIPTDNIFD